MLYTVFFTQIMFSVDSLDPGHCPRTSIFKFLKIGQVLLSPCSLHIYIYIYIYTLEFCSLHSQNYSKATTPGFSNSKATAPGSSNLNNLVSQRKVSPDLKIFWLIFRFYSFFWLIFRFYYSRRYLAEKLVCPEMTFNDLEGQNHIAYSAIRPNMSMYAKYHVDPCSG